MDPALTKKGIALPHDYQTLITLFNELFAESENTLLVSGDDEPLYRPAKKEQPAQVIFAHGFFASALHEIAHWCIAGTERRQLEDYGYWYQPDGRTASQQAEFESVEVKPQALEWIFHQSAESRFRVSADNLSGEATDLMPFKRAVVSQAQHYVRYGLPERAAKFQQRLLSAYRPKQALNVSEFQLDNL